MEETKLKEAFALFSQESFQLKGAYLALQTKMDLLNQKLIDSDQTLEAIIAHMCDGLIFLDGTGCIQFFNAAAEKFTGHKQEILLGTLYLQHFSDALFGFSVRDALEKKNVHLRSVVSLQNADLREIEVTASTIAEKGLLILLRDRTEIRQLEQSIQRNERLRELGEMAATLAHEIRNPLGGIEGFAALLACDFKENRQAHTMLQGILSGVRELNLLVTNVLDYARPIHFHFAKTNVTRLIQDTCEMMNACAINKCNCQFEAEGDFFYSVDQERFKIAICHLIRNACEASSEHATVLLKLSATCLYICDQGRGISREHIEMIFTPFFTTKTGGSGLGLSEAHKILQAHGGQIEVVSELGVGTTIIVRLGTQYDD